MRIEPLPSLRRRIVLTPLIDVIFLLLLFFMLSSSFQKFTRVEIAAATAGATAAGRTPDILIRLEAADRVAINGRSVALAEAAARLEALKQAGAKDVAVRAGSEAEVQALVGMLERLKSFGFEAVTVVP